MNHAVLLFGHADLTSFNHDLAAAYADGFTAAGGTVERFDLAALQFDPILRHGYRAEQPLEPDLVRVRAAIERADHLAWVFPTYWASPPTVVRGLVDRLLLRAGPSASTATPCRPASCAGARPGSSPPWTALPGGTGSCCARPSTTASAAPPCASVAWPRSS
jgi:NAD(P)H-dependent FMN reductase